MIQARPELRLDAAAQTGIVSVARIRLDPWESPRPFKGLICDDISEFESDHLSQAVGLHVPVLFWDLPPHQPRAALTSQGPSGREPRGALWQVSARHVPARRVGAL